MVEAELWLGGEPGVVREVWQVGQTVAGRE